MFRKIFITCTLFLGSLLATAQENDKYVADIKVVPFQNNKVSINSLCTNSTTQEKELNYVLSVQKKSQSGNTNNNKQSGTFYIASEQTKTLSSTKINFEPEDHIEIVLTIFDSEDVRIAQHKKLLKTADLLKY